MATRRHVVVKGETLGGIARRYGVAVAVLARANGLADVNRLRVGQVLVVPSVGVEPPWLRVARGEVGVKETAGAGDSARVVAYHGATVLASRQDEVAWCAAFVGWCLREAGLRGTGSAAARSYETWGAALDGPKVGCVVVLRRGTEAWQGHVGFVVGWTAAYVDVLGGNQGDRVCIQRFARARVRAWRWPSGGG